MYFVIRQQWFVETRPIAEGYNFNETTNHLSTAIWLALKPINGEVLPPFPLKPNE